MNNIGFKNDITGKKFGRLTALEFVGNDEKDGGAIWKFQCECGNTINFLGYKVVGGNKKSCGCLNAKNHPKINLSGQKFGRLTVLNYHGQSGRRRTMWKCRCDCGRETIVDGTHLRDGHTQSCGCLSREITQARSIKIGLSASRLYYVYRNMLNRCFREKDKNYNSYGERGITVCDEWLGDNGFVNFSKWAFENGYDMYAKRGKCTLDRINVNGNYEPANCRWVSHIIQSNNKRTTRFVSVDGEVGSVAMMARKYHINYNKLLQFSKSDIKYRQYNGHRIEAVKNGES